jgi:hypothetical protein
MTDTAVIFGFGSYFAKGSTRASDVDLLLLHRNVGRDSIQFAISCKRLIRAAIPAAHVVMLSANEERELDFIRRSNATHLADIDEIFASEQIATLCRPFVERTVSTV